MRSWLKLYIDLDLLLPLLPQLDILINERTIAGKLSIRLDEIIVTPKQFKLLSQQLIEDTLHRTLLYRSIPIKEGNTPHEY